MPQIIGGPFDGTNVPAHWQSASTLFYVNEESTTMAIYNRLPSGDYQFKGLVDESQLEKVEE
jgi:hypothetical protein